MHTHIVQIQNGEISFNTIFLTQCSFNQQHMLDAEASGLTSQVLVQSSLVSMVSNCNCQKGSKLQRFSLTSSVLFTHLLNPVSASTPGGEISFLAVDSTGFWAFLQVLSTETSQYRLDSSPSSHSYMMLHGFLPFGFTQSWNMSIVNIT